MLKRIHLMPGDTVEIEGLSDSAVPSPFSVRRLDYIQEHLSVVKEWMQSQGLHTSAQFDCEHSWDKIIPASMFEEHPEWFSLIGGERKLTQFHKLETTNQELIEYIARDAAQKHADGSLQGTYSLSPPDLYAFSESPESLSYYEYRNDGKHANMTRLIVQFYRDVCEAAIRLGSDVKFAGYLYSVYLDPPKEDIERLPDNFYPVLAPTPNYGFRLYRQDVRDNFESLLEFWSSKTDNLHYYDLPCWFRENSFVVTPPATGIIDYVFDMLIKYNVKGVIIYGMETWTQAAVMNYVIAQKLQNPHLRATGIRNEWLNLAYGLNAGTAMKFFYDELDSTFARYYQDNEEAFYHANDAVMRDLYAANYFALEGLLQKCYDCAMTTDQINRLNLVADNFSALGWWLKQRGFLIGGNPILTKTDTEIGNMLTTKYNGFLAYPKPPTFYKENL